VGGIENLKLTATITLGRWGYLCTARKY